MGAAAGNRGAPGDGDSRPADGGLRSGRGDSRHVVRGRRLAHGIAGARTKVQELPAGALDGVLVS